VLLTEAPEGVHVELVASDVGGGGTTRSLVVRTCEEAVEASAWILALWLDPTATSPAPSVEPVDTPPPPPVPVARPAAVPVESTTKNVAEGRRPASPWPSWGAGAEFGSFFTGLPSVPFGAGGFIEARWGAHGLLRPLAEVGVFGTGVGTADTERGSVHVSLVTARVRGCPLVLPARAVVSVSPCLIVELGRLSGRGSDTVAGREAAAFWRSLGLSAFGQLGIGDYVSIVAEAGIILPLFRDRFVFAPSPLLAGFSTPAAGASFSLGFRVHFSVRRPDHPAP
jgi:hypothetical protein